MTKPRRICIVTSGHLATNPRLVKEAQALTAGGHLVSIVSGSYLPWAVEEDRQLIDKSWTVVPVAFGSKIAPITVHLRQKMLQVFARSLYSVGIRSTILAGQAYAPSTIDLVRATVKLDPCDLYIGHYIPGLVAAARAALRHRSRYAFDAEDYHLGDLPDVQEYQQEKSWIRYIEATYLPGTIYLTAASPMIADTYAETYAIQAPTSVLNVFPRANAPTAPTPRGTVEPGPSLYWFSQTVGPGRGLEIAVEAIARALHRPHLYLRGTVTPGYAAELESLAAAHGVSSRLHFLPMASPSEMERLGSVYDLGFVGEQPLTLNRQIALTNKLFSYWTSGLPTVVSDIPAHRFFVSKYPSFVRAFTDAETLAATLDGLLGDLDGLAEARSDAYGAALDRYNWECEGLILQAVVQNALDVDVEGGASAMQRHPDSSGGGIDRDWVDSVATRPNDRRGSQ